VKALWQGTVLAESTDTIRIEGIEYFPRDSVNMDLLTPSDTKTVCPWKGEATYYTITVGGESNKDAAWTYPEPRDAAAEFKEHIAFWRGVEIKAD
jgi:uncharacterized protein (DUF427 family)